MSAPGAAGSPPPRSALRYAVVGADVSRSLSPRLHHALAAAEGVALTYAACSIPDAADLAGELRALFASGLAGVNVTIPYKAAALAFADRASPRAARLGVANCLARAADGAIEAHNTDAPALEHVLAPHVRAGDRVQLWGAGGAARAVVDALEALRVGAIVVSARRRDQAEALCATLAPRVPVEIVGLSPDPAAQVSISALPGAAWGDPGLVLGPARFALDLAYAPPGEATPLVARARAAGIVAADGLGMLVEQAALSQAIWRGVDLARARSVMRAAVGLD